MNESLLWQIRHFIMANPFSGIPTDFKWCAIESGAHAYAVKNGHYTSLSTWGKNSEGNLVGTLEMPMAVGIVAGWTLIAEKVVRIDRAEEILKALSGK